MKIEDGPVVAVYAGVGKTVRVYALEPATGALQPRQTIDDLVNDVHYVAVHPNGRVLYVAQGESPAPKDRPLVTAVSAFAIEPETGTLTRLGDSFSSPLSRVVHLSVDNSGRFLLMAHNFTESVSVVRLAPDGSLGQPVPQTPERQGLGFLVHQIRVDPTNRWVFVPVRGDDPPANKPGRLAVFALGSDGVLTPRHTVEYPPLLGPRHVDFHPTKPLVYLAVERSNLLITYQNDDGVLAERFRVETLADRSFKFPDQRAGAVRVHPNGRFLYVTNRNIAPCPASGTCREDHAFTGGENSVVVFALDEGTGEPKLLQHISSFGYEPRTMTLEPKSGFLVVANHKRVNEDHGGKTRAVAPNLAVFRVGKDGKLAFVDKVDQPDEAYWVGAVALR